MTTSSASFSSKFSLLTQSAGNIKFPRNFTLAAGLLLLTATIAVAQAPAEATAPAPRPVAELPLKLLLGRVPVAQVTIDGSRPLAVILDTGADDDILNARITRELKLHVLNPEVIEQPGGAIEMGQVENVQPKLASVPVQNLAMVSAPLDPLQPFIGQPLDGILGYGFFSQFVVEFDYAAKRVRLFAPETYVVPPKAVVIPITFRGKSPLVEITVEGATGESVKTLVEIDTGSFESLGLKGAFLDGHRLIQANAPKRPLFGLAIGGETTGYRTRLAAATLGPFRLSRPVTSATTSGDAGSADVGGVLGGEALNRFKVIVDYSRKQLLLIPNPELSRPSEYFDFLGAQIVSAGEHYNQFQLKAVMPDSPASEAALQSGDDIIAIDGQTTVRMSLEQVIGKFSKPGDRRRLDLARSGKRLTITVTTRRLL
ncbi:MAG TPA: aspartyl protease family protein [Chthoniobacterales bacterium]